MASPVATVLVVDDEPSLRLLCRVNLELDGFRVLEAGSLPRARELLETEPVDVVVLDVHVAGEDGRDLLDELRRERSSPRVAVLTGSVDLATPRLAPADRVLAKPFDPAQLVDVVSELAGDAAIDSAP